MPKNTLSAAQAAFELELLSSEAESVAAGDLYAWLREAGLPAEAAIRLTEFVEFSKRIGEGVVSVGKIVLLKIIEFVKAHPNLAAGVAVAAALTALVHSIPFLGPILAPLIALLAIPVGAVVGNRLDRQVPIRSNLESGHLNPIAELIDVAKIFFEFLASIFAILITSQDINLGQE